VRPPRGLHHPVGALSVRLPRVRARIDAAALRRARRARGLTQAGLARILGVAGGERVSAWERGVNQPDVALLPLMAAMLEVEPALLLGRSRAPRGLRALRWSAGLTATQVSAALHVSRNTYLRWESGARSMPRDASLVRRLADRLGVAAPVVLAAINSCPATKHR